MLKQQALKKVAECKRHCLAEFAHVNHYWDRQHNTVIAKILPGEFLPVLPPVADCEPVSTPFT